MKESSLSHIIRNLDISIGNIVYSKRIKGNLLKAISLKSHRTRIYEPGSHGKKVIHESFYDIIVITLNGFKIGGIIKYNSSLVYPYIFKEYRGYNLMNLFINIDFLKDIWNLNLEKFTISEFHDFSFNKNSDIINLGNGLINKIKRRVVKDEKSSNQPKNGN